MAGKQILLYGLLMGALLLLLEALQYKVALRDLSLDLFGIIIAVIFLGLGILIGVSWYQKKSLAGPSVNRKLGLSKREIEVLELLAKGLSNQEIADKLFVSLNTIKTHISNVYQKLNAKRRTQAIQKALELGLIAHSKG